MKDALDEIPSDPSGEIPSPAQLVHDLRGDLIASTLSAPDEIFLDEDLVAHWAGASKELISASADVGIDLKSELMRLVTRAPRPDDLLAILRDGPDRLYERAREQLRLIRDQVASVRADLDELQTHAGPSVVDPVQRHMTAFPRFDTREPYYSHKVPVTAVSTMVVNQTVGLVPV